MSKSFPDIGKPDSVDLKLRSRRVAWQGEDLKTGICSSTSDIVQAGLIFIPTKSAVKESLLSTQTPISRIWNVVFFKILRIVTNKSDRVQSFVRAGVPSLYLLQPMCVL
jgi:hypothetical protein